MTKLTAALADLIAAIDAGSEFPDVVGRIAKRHGVSVNRLTAKYDAI